MCGWRQSPTRAGPRPESGATTGEVPFGTVSELVLWGPRQAARALGKGVAQNPHPRAWRSLPRDRRAPPQAKRGGSWR